jgi:hypothetical protein
MLEAIQGKRKPKRRFEEMSDWKEESEFNVTTGGQFAMQGEFLILLETDSEKISLDDLVSTIKDAEEFGYQ